MLAKLTKYETSEIPCGIFLGVRHGKPSKIL
jgi:hypothetical protein